MIKIRNPQREFLVESSNFILMADPDLEALFESKNPPIPVDSTPKNLEEWGNMDFSSKQYVLICAYLHHPEASIKAKATNFAHLHGGTSIGQRLVNLLVDLDETVRIGAADAIWRREQAVNCKYAILSLRDEFRGYTANQKHFMGNWKSGLVIGEKGAEEAVHLLIDRAPDKKSKNAIKQFVSIEIPALGIEVEGGFREGAVRLLGSKNTRLLGRYDTYEADSEYDAITFLKQLQLIDDEHTVEVRTPGFNKNYVKDKDGIQSW